MRRLLSASLLESELFGHVKGAFTGAQADKLGRFELAHGGTLFLDEIGDISAETQVKLLRVLQQREFEPVGGTQSIKVDVRVVAATHQNLERLITEGKFREDLYYRLNVISIQLPPLRERPEDILDLSVSFLKAASTRGGKRIARFDDDALNALMRYPWPGNIRELQNVIERAVVLAEGETVELVDLPYDIQNAANSLRLGNRIDFRHDSSRLELRVPPCCGRMTNLRKSARKLADVRCATATKQKRRSDWDCPEAHTSAS